MMNRFIIIIVLVLFNLTNLYSQATIDSTQANPKYSKNENKNIQKKRKNLHLK